MWEFENVQMKKRKPMCKCADVRMCRWRKETNLKMCRCGNVQMKKKTRKIWQLGNLTIWQFENVEKDKDNLRMCRFENVKMKSLTSLYYSCYIKNDQAVGNGQWSAI